MNKLSTFSERLKKNNKLALLGSMAALAVGGTGCATEVGTVTAGNSGTEVQPGVTVIHGGKAFTNQKGQLQVDVISDSKELLDDNNFDCGSVNGEDLTKSTWDTMASYGASCIFTQNPESHLGIASIRHEMNAIADKISETNVVNIGIAY